MPAVRARLPMAQRQVPQFDRRLADHGLDLRRGATTTLQVNVGKLCNQACHHCHVEAGPKRTEIMPREVAARILDVVARNPGIATVDFTGGAPELNPHFRWLIDEVRRMGRHVIDRCNLTVLFEPGMDDLGEFLAARDVEIIASLPCYSERNVEEQRGHGVFARSIAGLRRLNELGYGTGGTRKLNLVYNPNGAFLPPDQAHLEIRYKAELAESFQITFDRLFTITNLPIARYADFLDAQGKFDEYMSLLLAHFNPHAVSGVMCRSLISVGWDGALYDCDFNQMLEMPLASARTIFDIESVDLEGESIATGPHCFGCTAGAGSSCGGSLV